jgi:hypothetical protein
MNLMPVRGRKLTSAKLYAKPAASMVKRLNRILWSSPARQELDVKFDQQGGHDTDAKPGPAISAVGGRVQQVGVNTRRRDLLRFSAAAVAAVAGPQIGHAATEGAKMTSGEIRHRTVETNGIHMHLAEQGEGPLIVLCHGFPESWYSWRHQLPALAAAGFRAVAPDMRGYGQTDRPAEIDQYTLLHLVGDMVGLRAQ